MAWCKVNIMTNLQLTIFTDHVVCENVKLDLEDVLYFHFFHGNWIHEGLVQQWFSDLYSADLSV